MRHRFGPIAQSVELRTFNRKPATSLTDSREDTARLGDSDEVSEGLLPPVATAATAEPADPVEAALSTALADASKAGRWDVVVQLGRELEARRLARSEATNVVTLASRRRGST